MSLQIIEKKIVQAAINRIVKEMDYNENNLQAIKDVLEMQYCIVSSDLHSKMTTLFQSEVGSFVKAQASKFVGAAITTTDGQIKVPFRVILDCRNVIEVASRLNEMIGKITAELLETVETQDDLAEAC